MLPVFNRRSAMPGLADEFFGRDLMSGLFEDAQKGVCIPAVNIFEGKNDFRIELAAPGLEKKDFKIDVKDKMLFIGSEKQFENENSEEKVMRREYTYSSFRRSFALPDSVDTEKISATHQNGILKITIPKKEEARDKGPRQIEIK